MSGIVQSQSISVVGTAIIPIKIHDQVYEVETIIARNINYNGTILIGLETMKRMKMEIIPEFDSIYINEKYIEFVRKDHSNETVSVPSNGSKSNKKRNRSNCKVSHQKNELPVKSILKQCPKNETSHWKLVKQSHILIRNGNCEPKKKAALISLDRIVEFQNNQVTWKLAKRKVIATLKNLSINDYKLIVISETIDENRSVDEMSDTLIKFDNLANEMRSLPVQFYVNTGEKELKLDDNLWNLIKQHNANIRMSKLKSIYIGSRVNSAKDIEIDCAKASWYFDAETNKHKVNFKLEPEIIDVENNLPDCSEINVTQNKKYTVSTVHKYDLTEQEAVVISCKISGSDNKENNLAITLPETTKVNGLVIESGLYPIRENSIQIKVYNIRGNEIRLKKGTCIGEIDIINKDFENEFKINVVNEDSGNKQISDNERYNLIREQVNNTDFKAYENELVNLLHEFKDIVAIKGDSLGITDKISHSINVEQNAKPIYNQRYRTAHSQQLIIENEVEKLEKEGIVEKSNSPWSFPLILVPKKDGGHRIVVDYRKLNSITENDPYPMPSMSELLNSLGKNKYFSTIDLMQGFLQVPLDESSKFMTGFSTANGHYHFNRMPFGLKSSPVTFVRLINTVFHGLLGKILHAYMDDLIIYGNSIQDHLENLRLVLSRLRDANLKIKLSKCRFLQSKCVFLGHEVSEHGIKVTQDKVAAVLKFSQPKTVKNLRSFLGLSGFYRRYIKDYSVIASPLTNLLKQNAKFEWSEEQEKAFQTLKKAITEAPILVFPDFSKTFYLVTDASGVGIGSALMQKDENNKFRVIAYHSRKLKDAEKRYSITEQECLAVIDSLKHFRFIIFQYNVIVLTDHSALTEIFKNPNHSARRARWFVTIMDYNVTFKYIPGKKNVVADCLSRYDLDENNLETLVCSVTNNPSISEDIIEIHQTADATLRKIKEELGKEIRLEKIESYHLCDFEILNGLVCKIIGDESKIVVPKGLVDKVIHLHHDVRGHPGREETIRQIKLNYIWSGLSKDVKEYVISCKLCSSCRGKTKVAPLNLYPTPQTPFERIAIDLLKLTTTSCGNTYILVCTDYLTRFVELYAQKSKTAKETALNVYRFIMTHGAPEILMSDNGLEFDNKMLEELLIHFRTEKVNILPYHPSSNGLVERVNRKILDILKSILPGNIYDWDDYLLETQYILNTRIHSSIDMSPYYALYGFKPRLPFEMNHNKFKTKIENNPLQARVNNSQVIHHNLQISLNEASISMQERQHEIANQNEFRINDLIYVKRKNMENTKLQPKFKGPYKIIEKRHGNKYMIQELESGKIILAHADDFKIFISENKSESTTNDTSNEQTDTDKNLNIEENQSTVNRKSPRLQTKTPINYEESDVESEELI